MARRAAALALTALCACNPQDPPPDPAAATGADGTAGAGTHWHLHTLNGAAPPVPVTLIWPEGTGPRRLSGMAPCNRYFAAVSGPAAQPRLGPIGASKRACPHLAFEDAYLRALAATRNASRTGSSLTLTGPGGTRLSFSRAAPSR